MRVVKNDAATIRFAHRVSARVLELIERECREAGFEPSYAAFVMHYVEGRFFARYGDLGTTAEQGWELLKADALRPVFVAGYQSERE